MLLTEKNAKSVGFVQIGMLPPPPGFPSSLDRDDNAGASSGAQPVGVPVNLDESQQRVPDVPYIANLCVLPSFRRKGLGKKMVHICIQWLAKPDNLQHVCVAVEADNLEAQRFYQGNGFTWIEPPMNVRAKREYYFRSISSSSPG
jgi:ribosomal protein S18 acetylase RimI-like enzyme